MHCLSQLENGILATKKDFEEFSKKENSKILVLSDSHGAAELIFSILQKFGPQVDAMVFAGDGIFDILDAIEKAKKHFSTAKCIPPVIAFAKGNNDPSLCETDFLKKITVPAKVIFKAGAKKILVSHGNSEGVYYGFSALETVAQKFGANAAIFGHTHVPAEIMGTTYIMNPGSISLPRHRSFPSFAVLEIFGKNMTSIFYKIENKMNYEFTPYHPESFYGF